jgi:S1-C subfamily serine protease
MEGLMTQLLSQLSDSITLLVANAAPVLTAIRIGQNRHVTGFLWRGDLVVTSDQALPAAAGYTIVLSTGALISAQPGPRDPVNNLASLRLDSPVTVTVPEPASSATIGALVLALGADFDGSPTVRLTSIFGFPRSPGAGAAAAAITLDLSGGRVNHGGMVLDAEGRLLGMTSVSPSGDAIVVPHGVIARFVEAATANVAPGTAALSQTMTLPTVQPIPQVAVQAPADPVTRNGHTAPTSANPTLANPTLANHENRRGWLGVSLQPITVPEGLTHRAGQRTARQVVSTTRGGPADRAGLRAGDVLLALDGSSTSGNHALRAFLVPEKIGSQVQVRLMRDGMVHTTVLTIAPQPE